MSTIDLSQFNHMTSTKVSTRSYVWCNKCPAFSTYEDANAVARDGHVHTWLDNDTNASAEF